MLIAVLPLTTTSYQRIAIVTILGPAVIAGVVTGAMAQCRLGRPVRVQKDFGWSFRTNLAGLLIMFGCGTVVAPGSQALWARMAGYSAGLALSVPAVVWLVAVRARESRRRS